jgi:hypothetical protein
MKIKHLFIVLGILVLSGCKTIGPAAFWNEFDDGHLVKSITDQGPWGGYRLMYWKNTDHPYQAKMVIAFAALNKWECFDTDSLNKNDMRSWMNDHGDLFLLHHNPYYPRINDMGVSFSFVDSNWASNRSDPTKPPLGYILLSKDGKQLVVFHSWGEQ